MFKAIRDAIERFRHWREVAKRNRERNTAAYPWHITNAYTDSSFNFYGTYREAVEELRHRTPGALIVHVDHDDGLEGNQIGKTIFYRVAP